MCLAEPPSCSPLACPEVTTDARQRRHSLDRNPASGASHSDTIGMGRRTCDSACHNARCGCAEFWLILRVNRSGKAKQPYCFQVNAEELFAFAGICDCWRDRNGTAVETCSILTTTANSVTRVVHDRMPAILDRSSFELWLDPAMRGITLTSRFLKPYSADQIKCYPVSSRVNNVIHDDEDCSRSADPVGIQHDLF